MAERVGFEPTVEFPLHTLSKRAPSTARTSLREKVTGLGLVHASGLTTVHFRLDCHLCLTAVARFPVSVKDYGWSLSRWFREIFTKGISTGLT